MGNFAILGLLSKLAIHQGFRGVMKKLLFLLLLPIYAFAQELKVTFQAEPYFIRAYVNGQDAGYVSFHPISDNPRKIYIDCFEVYSAFRNQKVGTSLFQEALRLFEQERTTDIFLNARPFSNGPRLELVPLTNFYKKHGFNHIDAYANMHRVSKLPEQILQFTATPFNGATQISAYLDNKMLGSITTNQSLNPLINCYRHYIKRAHTGYIQLFALDSHEENPKISTSLMQKAIEQCKKNGCREITLKAAPFWAIPGILPSPELIKFYQKFGFKEAVGDGYAMKKIIPQQKGVIAKLLMSHPYLSAGIGATVGLTSLLKAKSHKAHPTAI